MAHKTKIGDSYYEVKGGKTKIGTDVYEIKGGKTKIGDAVYDIEFAAEPLIVYNGGNSVLVGSFKTPSTNQTFIDGTNGHIRVSSQYIQMPTGGYGTIPYPAIIGPVDMSGYSTLKVECWTISHLGGNTTSISYQASYGTAESPLASTSFNAYMAAGTGTVEASLDISDADGEYYIKLQNVTQATSNSNFTKIWLE